MAELLSLPQVAALAAQLPPAARRQLAEAILRELDFEAAAPPRRRAWREIRGSAPYPLFGEDIQAWVTRTRRESDDARERQLRSPE